MSDWRKETLVWEVDGTDAFTGISGTINIRKVIFIPTAANDDLVFQDSGSVNAIVLKAGAGDASPIHVDFGEKGKWLNGIKCTTIDGASSIAYVYLR